MIKVPKSRSGQFLFSLAQTFVAYTLICACTRAQALGLYGWTATSSLIFCLQSFVAGKIMIEDENARTWSSGAGFIVGGVCGDLVSLWITKRLYGA